MAKIKVFQVKIIREAKAVYVEEGDQITVQAAAELRGVTWTSIMSMMESGTLPMYRSNERDIPGIKTLYFTSKKAVLDLGKESAPARTTRGAAAEAQPV